MSDLFLAIICKRMVLLDLVRRLSRLGARCVTPRRRGKVVFWPTVLPGSRGVELNMRELGQRLTHLVGITLHSRDHRSNGGKV